MLFQKIILPIVKSFDILFLQDVGTGPNDYVNLWQKPPQQGHEMIILDDLEPSQNSQKKSSVSTSTHFLQGKMSQTDNFEDPR